MFVQIEQRFVRLCHRPMLTDLSSSGLATMGVEGWIHAAVDDVLSFAG